jgi:hypothetical protein
VAVVLVQEEDAEVVVEVVEVEVVEVVEGLNYIEY